MATNLREEERVRVNASPTGEFANINGTGGTVLRNNGSQALVDFDNGQRFWISLRVLEREPISQPSSEKGTISRADAEAAYVAAHREMQRTERVVEALDRLESDEITEAEVKAITFLDEFNIPINDETLARVKAMIQ